MSNFAVEWKPDVLGDLTKLWLNAPDRKSVTKAAHKIDKLLEQDPAGVGTDLHEGLRNLHVPPLEVTYEISEDRNLVEVVAVKTRE